MTGSNRTGVGADQVAGADVEKSVVAMDLEVGQQLSATVLELLGGGRVLVGFRGVKVEARSQVPLELGGNYLFTVVAYGDKLKLALVLPSTPEDPGKILLARLLARGGGSGLHLRLTELRRELTAQGLAAGSLGIFLQALGKWPRTSRDIQQLTKGLGINHEAVLLQAARRRTPAPTGLAQNLKALLLNLVTSAPNGVATAAKAALASLEALQGENIHRQKLGGSQVYPLPSVPGVRSGELHISSPPMAEEQAGEVPASTEPYRLVIMLDLERLGPLRIDLEVLAGELRILFRSPLAETVETLEKYIGELQTELRAKGLQPLAVDVWRTRERELPPPGDPMPQRSDQVRLVDVNG